MLGEKIDDNAAHFCPTDGSKNINFFSRKTFETNYSSPLTAWRVITRSICTPIFFFILSASYFWSDLQWLNLWNQFSTVQKCLNWNCKFLRKKAENLISESWNHNTYRLNPMYKSFLTLKNLTAEGTQPALISRIDMALNHICYMQWGRDLK